MQDKNAQLIILRTLSIMLFVIALGMVGARMFGGIDLSPVISLSLMTVAISLLVVAQVTDNKRGREDKPD